MERNLPTNWAVSALHELSEVVAGNPAPQGMEFFEGGTYPFVRVHDMGGNNDHVFLRKTRDLVNEKAAKNLKLFPVGSVLFTKSGASTLLNQRAILENNSFVVSHIAVSIPATGVGSKWLYYWLTLIDFATLAHATNMPSLPLSRAKNIEVPLASENEQHRIVAKIEELFSELDNGIKSLKTARGQLKLYRQAVLKHAFEGKLTADWREQNKDKLETTDQLLTRIKTERQARYQQQLTDWKTATKAWNADGKQGKKPSKPRKPKLDFSGVNTCYGDKILPWLSLPLELLAIEAVLGKMLDKQKNKGTERPYLGNINLRWGRFDLKNLKYIKIEDSEVPRYSLCKGDLVICEGGEPGRCAVWEGEGEGNEMFIQKALHRVRFTKSYAPQFAYYFLSFSAVSGLLAKNFTGTTIKHLTGAGLSQVLFPVCSISEQIEIINKIEELLSKTEVLETEIETSLIKAETFRQSILKKAFSGKLVAQNPDDEPASILLERIKAEKGIQKKNKKNGGRNAA